MSTEILALQEIGVGDAQKELLYSIAMRNLEAVLIRVLSRSGGVPATPAEGDTYIVDATTGDWADFSIGDLVHYYGGAYRAYAIPAGLTVAVLDENGRQIMYNGSVWEDMHPGNAWASAGAVTRNSDNATDATTQVMATITIAANTMGPNDSLRITALWTCTNSANAKTLTTEFEGVAYSSQIMASGDATLQTVTQINNDNDVTAQIGAPAGLHGAGKSTSAPVTSSVDTGLASDITLECAWSGNVAGESIVLEKYLVEMIKT